LPRGGGGCQRHLYVVGKKKTRLRLRRTRGHHGAGERISFREGEDRGFAEKRKPAAPWKNVFERAGLKKDGGGETCAKARPGISC